MTVQNLIDSCHFTIFAKENLSKTVTGCYIGDILSLAMSRIQKGPVWVTVQGNVNIAAVAALTEPACIILAEGRKADADTLAKALENGITILGTEESAYQTACVLFGQGIGKENEEV